MMKNTFKKLITHYNEKGLFNTFSLVAKNLLKRAVSIFYKGIDFDIWTLDLGKVEDSPMNFGNEYGCRHLQMEDLPEIQKRFGELTAKDFETRLKNAKCYIIFNKEGIIGYSWSSENRVEKQGDAPFYFNVEPKEGMIYLYGDFIIPSKRGRGANKRLMQYRLAECKKARLKRGFGLIERRNLPQIRTVKNSGQETGGRLTYRRYLCFVRKNTSILRDFCK